MIKALKYIGVWLLTMIVGALIAAIPASIFVVAFDKGYTWSLVLAMLFADLLPLYVFWKRRYTNFSFLWSERAKQFYLWVLIAGLGYFLVEVFLEQYISFPDEDGDWKEALGAMMQNPLGIIEVCLLAPIVEEAVCRGAILRALLKKNWNCWVAIVVSAMVFGLAHMNLTQGVPAFVWGIFIGWIFYRTRSIWPGVIIHMMNNTFATIASFCLPETALSPEWTTPLIYTLVFVPVGLFLLVIAIKKINRMADDVDLSIPFLDEEDIKALRQAEAARAYVTVDAPIVVGTPMERIEPIDNVMTDDDMPIE